MRKDWNGKDIFELVQCDCQNLPYLTFNREDQIQYYMYGQMKSWYTIHQDLEVYFEHELPNKGFIDLAIIDDGEPTRLSDPTGKSIVGLEIKLNPDKNELHRLVGQMWDYHNYFEYLIGFIVFNNQKLISIQNFMNSIPTNSKFMIKILDPNGKYKQKNLLKKGELEMLS